MPTPIEVLLDPVSLGVLGLYGALILWETLAPAKALPRVWGWPQRAGRYPVPVRDNVHGHFPAL
jgi:hypothetical protein